MKSLAGHRENSDKNPNKPVSFIAKNLAIQSRVGARKSAERKNLFPNENNNADSKGQPKAVPRYMAPQRREPRKASTVAQSMESDTYNTIVRNITRDLSPNTALISSGRGKDVSPKLVQRGSSRPTMGSFGGVERQNSYGDTNPSNQRSEQRTSCISPNPMSPEYKESR